jgi:hypothetical protein
LLLAGLALLLGIAYVAGWIVRGFLGIPMGADEQLRKPEEAA